jgi:hypothetical protein
MTPPLANTRSHAPPAPLNTADQVCLSPTPVVAITILRSGFQTYGFDVSAFPDSTLSWAILLAAHPHPGSSRELYARAFERLQSQRGEAT